MALVAEMMKGIRLENIEVKVLSTTIADSGFFSKDRLMEAYRIQALGQDTKRARFLPVWKSSGMDVATTNGGVVRLCDVVDCSPMTEGVHRWVMDVEEGEGIWLGVALSITTVNSTSFLPFQKGTCMFHRGGSVNRDGTLYRDIMFTYGTGSRLTFTLNLLPEEKRGGRLTCQVVDNSFTIVQGLREPLAAESTGVGFVPAAAADLGYPASVRLLNKRTRNPEWHRS